MQKLIFIINKYHYSTNAPQSYRVDPNQESNLSQLTFSVTGLTTGLQYEVFVRAHTTVGEGSPSNRIHVEVTSRGKIIKPYIILQVNICNIILYICSKYFNCIYFMIFCLTFSAHDFIY